MPYLKPEHTGSQSTKFCRTCGTQIETSAAAWPVRASSKDPEELTGNGIGAVFVGDGLLMVAVILSATQTSVSSLLWLLLLIPAFFFFGKGFGDVLHARQIQRRIKQHALNQEESTPELEESGNRACGLKPNILRRTRQRAQRN